MSCKEYIYNFELAGIRLHVADDSEHLFLNASETSLALWRS